MKFLKGFNDYSILEKKFSDDDLIEDFGKLLDEAEGEVEDAANSQPKRNETKPTDVEYNFSKNFRIFLKYPDTYEPENGFLESKLICDFMKHKFTKGYLRKAGPLRIRIVSEILKSYLTEDKDFSQKPKLRGQIRHMVDVFGTEDPQKEEDLSLRVQQLLCNEELWKKVLTDYMKNTKSTLESDIKQELYDYGLDLSVIDNVGLTKNEKGYYDRNLQRKSRFKLLLDGINFMAKLYLTHSEIYDQRYLEIERRKVERTLFNLNDKNSKQSIRLVSSEKTTPKSKSYLRKDDPLYYQNILSLPAIKRQRESQEIAEAWDDVINKLISETDQ